LTGLVYKHIVPRGITIYANYTVVALDKFRKHLLKMRPEMVEGACFTIKTKPLSTLLPLSGISWLSERFSAAAPPTPFT
jgi:hypothetical protein